MQPQAGGLTAWVDESSRILQSLGYLVDVACLDGPSPCETPYKIHYLGPGAGHYGYSNQYYQWLLRELSHFDCIWVEGLWQYHGRAFKNANKLFQKPYFVFPHGMLDPWFNKRYPLKWIKKTIYWWFTEHCLLERADAVIYTAREEAHLARHSFWPAAPKGYIASLGVEDPKVHLCPDLFYEAYPKLKNKRILLFLGRMHEKKGTDILIKAWLENSISKDPHQILVLVGPCQERKLQKILNNYTYENAQTNLYWLGMLQGCMKWAALSAASGFVLPSYQENFGIAVVEAMASSLPVFITKAINIWKEVDTYNAGFICDPGPQGVSVALAKWATLSRSKEDLWGNNGRTCFEKLFEAHRAVNHLCEILNKKIPL